jgi:hypothetical protein
LSCAKSKADVGAYSRVSPDRHHKTELAALFALGWKVFAS